MSRREKRLQSIRMNQRNVRFEDLAALLRDRGFVERAGKGSHVVFKNYDTGLRISIPKPPRGTLNPVYVREALALLGEDDG